MGNTDSTSLRASNINSNNNSDVRFNKNTISTHNQSNNNPSNTYINPSNTDRRQKDNKYDETQSTNESSYIQQCKQQFFKDERQFLRQFDEYQKRQLDLINYYNKQSSNKHNKISQQQIKKDKQNIQSDQKLFKLLQSIQKNYNKINDKQISQKFYQQCLYIQSTIQPNQYLNDKEIQQKDVQQKNKIKDWNYDPLFEIARQTLQKKFRLASKLNNIGTIYFLKQSYTNSLTYYLRSLKLVTPIKLIQSSQILQIVFLNKILPIKIYEQLIKKFNQEQQLLQKVLKMKFKEQFKNNSTLNNMSIILNNIANVYSSIGQFKLSKRIYKKCIQIICLIQNKSHHSNNYSIILNNLATIYNYQQKYDKSIQKYLQCLQISQNNNKSYNNNNNKQSKQTKQAKYIKYTKYILSIKNNLALIYQNKQDYHESLKYYKQCLQLQKSLTPNNLINIASLHFNISEVYQKLNNISKAFQHAKKSFKYRKYILGDQNKITTNTFNHLIELSKLIPQIKTNPYLLYIDINQKY